MSNRSLFPSRVIVAIGMTIAFPVSVGADTGIEEADVANVRAKIETLSDEFSKYPAIGGPWRSAESAPYNGSWRMVATVTSPTAVHIIVRSKYSDQQTMGMVRYSSGAMVGGDAVEIVNVDRDVASCTRGGCSYSERVVVKLSDGHLFQKPPQPVRFRIRGDRADGAVVVTISPAYQIAMQREICARLGMLDAVCNKS